MMVSKEQMRNSFLIRGCNPVSRSECPSVFTSFNILTNVPRVVLSINSSPVQSKAMSPGVCR